MFFVCLFVKDATNSFLQQNSISNFVLFNEIHVLNLIMSKFSIHRRKKIKLNVVKIFSFYYLATNVKKKQQQQNFIFMYEKTQ